MSSSGKLLKPSLHLIIVTVLGAMCWAYWPGLVNLFEVWNSDPDYNHGFLVVPISAWLLWQRREKLAEITIAPSWWGLAFVALAAVVRWLGAEFFFAEFDTWSLPLWVAGAVLLFGGWQLLWWASGAIAFLWFMTPLPGTLTQALSLPLQKISAVISTWTLHLCAQPAVRQGTTIIMGEHTLEVERACSGLRICYGILALAVAYVVLQRPRPLRAVVLLLAAIPVAVIANSARVTLTGLLFLVVSGEQAHKYAHDFSGLVMLPMAVALLWLVHRIMERVLAAFEESPAAGGILLFKWVVPMLVVAAGLVFWQQKQADAAVGTLLTIAEKHEKAGKQFVAEKDYRNGITELQQAVFYLDRYSQLRPDDVAAAKRLAEVAESMAFNSSSLVRAARMYQRVWSMQEEDHELGLKKAALSLAGQDFNSAIAAADKLLGETNLSDEQQLKAYQIKLQAQIGDTQKLNSKTTWEEVTDTLEYGIEEGLDPAVSAYQLALIYRQQALESISTANRAAEAEKVLNEMVSKRSDDPLVWFFRSSYLQQYPPKAGSSATPSGAAGQTGDNGANAVPDADRDMDQAIALASKDPQPATHPIWFAAAERALKNMMSAKKNVDTEGAKSSSELAEQYFRKAIETNPDQFRSYLGLVRVLVGGESRTEASKTEVTLDQRQAAVAVLRQALQKEQLQGQLMLRTEMVWHQLQLNDEAEVAEANEQLRELRSELRNLSPERRAPIQLDLAILESQVYAKSGNFEKASKTLHDTLRAADMKEIRKGNGYLSSAWLMLSGYYERQGLPEKMQECVAEAQKAEPGSIQNSIFDARVAEQAGNLSEAADMYQDLAVRMGNRSDMWVAAAASELKNQESRSAATRDFTQFRKNLAQAKELQAPLDEIAPIESEYRVMIGETTEAVRILEEAADRRPDSAELWRRLALVRLASGDAAGSEAAFSKYGQLSGSTVQSAILQSQLFAGKGDLQNARKVLQDGMAGTKDLNEQKRLLDRLIQLERLNNQPQAVGKLLEEFAQQHPEDVSVQLELAEHYWITRQFEAMEQTEQRIKTLEGDNGVQWKELRARRLIELARRVQDDSQRMEMLKEAKTLAESLSSSTVNVANVQSVLGRLAIQDRQFAQAAVHFKQAWKDGNKSVLSSIELLYALQASGNATEMESYLEQMQGLLQFSPEVFDMALAIKSRVTIADHDKSVEIANNWVKSVGDAASYLRLARTLLLKPERRNVSRQDHLQEIETAYRRAMELNPKNPQAWGELIRFLHTDRKDRVAMLKELQTFVASGDIPELDRNFAAAQLLTELQERSSANRFWEAAISLVMQRDDRLAQIRVLGAAAPFFASFDSKRAAEVCRQINRIDPDNLPGQRMLAALLSDTDSDESLKEASTLIQPWLASNRELNDVEKRIVASVLYRRSQRLAAEFNKTDDLARASNLLKQLGNKSESDGIQQALIAAAMGEESAAYRALDEESRRANASPSTVVAFIDFWQKHFESSNKYFDRAEQSFTTLEKAQATEILSLELRLRPEGLTAEKKAEIVRQFLTRISKLRSAPREQEVLLQKTFGLLASKGLHDLSLQILTDETPPLTKARKLQALLTVSIKSPGPDNFEASLKDLAAKELDSIKSPDAERVAADFYFMREAWPEAERYYRQCLERDPNDVVVANNLSIVVVESRGELEEADRLITQGLALLAKKTDAPAETAFLLDTQSQLLLYSGKAKEAFAILNPLSQSPTADASVFLHLAEALRQMGQPEESKRMFTISKQLGIDPKAMAPMDRKMYDALVAAFANQA